MTTVLASTCVIAAPGPQRGSSTWMNPAEAADFDFDGYVDDADFALFSLQYDALDCADPAMPEECSADLNHDGVVNDADFALFVREYNKTLSNVS